MKDSFGDKIFYACNYGILLLIALTCLFPLLHIVSLSLSDAHSIMSGIVTFWPRGWSIESYRQLFENTRIIPAFGNSAVITLVGSAISMIMTILTAYPLSRAYFIGRRFFTLAAVFTMMFAGGMIPHYLLMKQLGLINTYWSLWLPAAVSVYNLLVLRTFFANVPEEIEEAARMDGCGEWRMLMRIMLPLSLPALATLTLFYAVGYWNSFMSVLIYINETHKYNLTVLVQQMIRKQSVLTEMVYAQPDDVAEITGEGIKAAGIMVMIIPMLIVYPLLQRYFVKGVMLGSVKG
ncbi:carbohydrate ABC transporter permease [Paenibacillus methanolicus]|uniref:Putative aldouronate transport system permease protein n=1 Tax=Paenibacillus methanolicus TaxID=582686 RepID=A0A5S5CBE9_9BACL|nr:carbohydrate ABC transporter permease [Paenibacillus methanolicus]TYP76489.1 putative aldouronate transport system permease protein [Paenibacillus methanolicus]